MRLIDADAWLRETHFQEGIYPHTTLKKEIEALPTIEVESVKHGRWILHDNGSGTCDQCRFTQKNVWDDDNAQNYCGVCGAKMDGGASLEN